LNCASQHFYAAALLVGSLAACENLTASAGCYYNDNQGFGSTIEVRCGLTEPPIGFWKLCGTTKTLDDCSAWLRRQGIAA